MSRVRVGIPGALAGLALFVCCVADSAGAADRKADIEAIKAVQAEWVDAYVKGDLERLVSLYTEDAVAHTQNRPALRGRDEIRRSIGASMAKWDRKVEIDINQ
jgi:ketosteroid isomerase-like protein